MLNAVQGQIVVGLVRKKARILRGEKFKPLRLMHSLIWAGEALVPEQYLLPFSSSLTRVIQESHFDRASLPPAVGSLLNINERCRKDNFARLQRFAGRIEKEFSSPTRDAVLAGEGGALAVIYGDLGAFPVTEWAALLRDGRYANGSHPIDMAPPAEDWSDAIPFGQIRWRRPKPTLLIALLARHIGDPGMSPMPPVWPHLGAALFLWREKIGMDEVLRLSNDLRQRGDVERGLAIIAQIFPELQEWVDNTKLSIPRRERKYAVPIAARRIVIGGRD
jgi:hypothetical protein